MLSKKPVSFYLLCDANNFYVSCERIFNPGLEGKPVIVLSNRDGCVIARSNEAKAIGIKMCQPFFMTEEIRKKQKVNVLSSNYALYGDISARFMRTLGTFADNMEVYSIDEAFLQVEAYRSVYGGIESLARTIRETVMQWIGIPVSIGVAPTKTLAKIANWHAKRRPELNGVCELTSQTAIDQVLADFNVGELWGVGDRSAAKLRRVGIKTAAQFRDTTDGWLGQVMTVNGVRIAHELRGRPCKLLEVEAKPKKTIMTAPSFGRLVPDLDTMADALTTYLARACEKLRRQDCACEVLTVFLHTDQHRKSPNGQLAKQYYNAQTVALPHPTNNTAEMLKYAQAALTAVFRFGYQYQKVGVILNGIVPASHQQIAVFTAEPDERMRKLVKVVDRINHRHGQDRVRLASQRYNPDWVMKQQYLSKRYTTRWDEILVAK